MKTGLIYKLCSRDPTVKEIYIGSTTNPKVRKWCHKSTCNNPNGLHYNLKVYQYIRENGGFENWDLIVIEANIHYTEKHELRTRERYWLEHLKATLNSQVPNQTNAESSRNYKEVNREALNEHNRNYRQANREVINEKRRKKKTCICGATYTYNNITHHIRSKKHTYWQTLYEYINTL